MYFGEEALNNHLHLHLRWPLVDCLVHDVGAAKDFIRHIRSLVDNGRQEVWVTVGIPSHQQQDNLVTLREALADNFHRFLAVPEPFLAASGFRQEERLSDPKYIDPAKHSMIVDAGAGTTDFCYLQGLYPGPGNQISDPVAGNEIDQELKRLINQKYPDAKLSDVSITPLKENNSYVGKAPRKITFEIPIHGKPHTLDITELIGRACELIVPHIVGGITELTKRCSAELVERMLSNIVLTGGCSMIRNLPTIIQERLQESGLRGARVSRVEKYKALVARGALKLAQSTPDDEWQYPTLT